MEVSNNHEIGSNSTSAGKSLCTRNTTFSWIIQSLFDATKHALDSENENSLLGRNKKTENETESPTGSDASVKRKINQ